MNGPFIKVKHLASQLLGISDTGPFGQFVPDSHQLLGRASVPVSGQPDGHLLMPGAWVSDPADIVEIDGVAPCLLGQNKD